MNNLPFSKHRIYIERKIKEISIKLIKLKSTLRQSTKQSFDIMSSTDTTRKSQGLFTAEHV